MLSVASFVTNICLGIVRNSKLFPEEDLAAHQAWQHRWRNYAEEISVKYALKSDNTNLSNRGEIPEHENLAVKMIREVEEEAELIAAGVAKEDAKMRRMEEGESQITAKRWSSLATSNNLKRASPIMSSTPSTSSTSSTPSPSTAVSELFPDHERKRARTGFSKSDATDEIKSTLVSALNKQATDPMQESRKRVEAMRGQISDLEWVARNADEQVAKNCATDIAKLQMLIVEEGRNTFSLR
jgi:hypothetical protein